MPLSMEIWRLERNAERQTPQNSCVELLVLLDNLEIILLFYNNLITVFYM